MDVTFYTPEIILIANRNATLSTCTDLSEI